MTILKRVLFFIPIAFIMLVNSLLMWARTMILYAKYGGETMIYSKDDRKSIRDIYFILKGVHEDLDKSTQ